MAAATVRTGTAARYRCREHFVPLLSVHRGTQVMAPQNRLIASSMHRARTGLGELCLTYEKTWKVVNYLMGPVTSGGLLVFRWRTSYSTVRLCKGGCTRRVFVTYIIHSLDLKNIFSLNGWCNVRRSLNFERAVISGAVIVQVPAPFLVTYSC